VAGRASAPRHFASGPDRRGGGAFQGRLRQREPEVQVSDTDIKSKQIRRTALRHALMSFPLVAVIIATSINLVSGLAK
jgi:hypothetical protein